MSKIKLKTILKKEGLKTFSSDIIGIFSDGKIKYKDENASMVISIEEDRISLKRITEEAELLLNFAFNKRLEGSYYIKEFGRSFPIYVKTIDLKQKEGYLSLKYIQELGEEKTNFEFALTYEVIECKKC